MKKRALLLAATVAVSTLLMAAGGKSLISGKGLAGLGGSERQATEYLVLRSNYGTGRSVFIQNNSVSPSENYTMVKEDLMMLRTARLTLVNGTNAYLTLVRPATEPLLFLGTTSVDDTKEFHFDPAIPLAEGDRLLYSTDGQATLELQGTPLVAPFNSGELLVIR